MWPQALQMTRDECRGILRRLELESYSQVISVFRAQGGLSDAKAKLLEELRGIFHISNERHRAEARRVANDEQLATIAEAISGPNTWQEWSREGRRPYPMLPRVAPQTALALLANNVAEETAQENSKLPYPAETAEAIKEEQQQIEHQKSLEAAVERNNYVVTNDPFKIPEIPQNPKKNLKRNSEHHQNSGAGKKRSTGENSAQQGHTQTARKNYPHITANSPQTNNATASMNVSGERKQKLNATDQYMEKQRFFHRQHQLAKQKMAKKAAAAAAAANNAAMGIGGGGGTPIKRQATPAKSGRRANQKLQQEQQKQLAMKQLQMDMQQQQQQQQVPMQIDLTVGGAGATTAAQAILTQQQIDMQFVTYATHHQQPPQQIFMEKDIEMAHSQLTALSATGASTTSAITIPVSSSNQHPPPSLITPLSSPQIAASKRDISKNLNKLQMQQNQQQLTSSVSNIASSLPAPAPIPSHDLQTSLGNILTSSSSSTTTSDKIKPSEKTLISTTPVQKYIVEERQPGVSINLPAGANTGTLVNIQNPHGTSSTTPTHIIQVSNAGQQPQIMSFPQISAAATKLRAVNTTLIAPGTKITSTPTKKVTTSSIGGSSGGASSNINAGALHELANIASTQSQVLHIVEAAGNNNPTNVPHATPLHTPPAVIQIHNTVGTNTATSPDISTASTQSKVLTTKILPLVLSSGTAGNQSNANNTLLNNSTLVMASSPTSSVSSITSTTSTAGGTTIIKNIPSSMVLNTSTANLTPVTVTSTNNPIISTLGAGATVFRKPPNIIKSSVSATTPTKSTSPSSAPHIISNVKLTPVSVNPSSAGTHLTTTSTFKNVLPSTSGMVRTSVKICQSPNGKVFIQPANLVDGSKMKINTGTMSHKIISNASTANSTATTSSGQRIAIQKVQIIPAPMGSPAPGGAHQGAGNHINTKTGKSNMIFMPTSATNVRPVTLSKMGNNILLKSSANQQMTTTSPTTTIAAAGAGDNTIAKSNIVVLGPSPTTSVKEQLPQGVKLENSQLINEDAPLDILNMPIVMEPGVGVTSSSSAAETVTVLQSNIIDASNVSSSSTLAAPIILDQTHLQQPSKTVVLNVDWEMKLDIEQQNQYNNKNLKQNKRTLSTSSSATTSTSGNQQQTSTSPSSHVIKQKRLNNDYISMELKAKESSNPTIVTATNSANNMIVLDDSFDDVIVEEHEDDASSVTSLDKHSQQQQHQQQPSDDIPKILDMQIYQQHDGHDNRIAQITTTTNNNDDVDIDVNDEEGDGDDYDEKHQSRQFSTAQESTRTEDIDQTQQLHREEHQQPLQQHAECDIDAGFDETIVTEIDENTAIEYIEEDGTSSNVSTTTTTATTTVTSSTILSKKNNMQLKTTTATSTSAAIGTVPTTVTTTTNLISKQEDIKTSNTISNNYLATSMSGDKISATTTTTATSNENLTIEPTATNATQETTKTANNSATQQVEP
ncbi:serine-rich adhesin for platelets [Lucilia cuprina]|uniref:serine-rich adhesin for platelets n=1 Tax=Lucilia cuprina TaxID=7375 RepID=UPI001F06E9EF|nr:serine-rich adhesin for platelets [Lucilia cuprina]